MSVEITSVEGSRKRSAGENTDLDSSITPAVKSICAEDLKSRQITSTDSKNGQLPDIYIMSNIPKLAEKLKLNLPPKANLKVVEVADKQIRLDSCMNVKPEEIQALQKAEILVIDSMLLAKTMYQLPNLKWAQSTLSNVRMVLDQLNSSKPKPNFILTKCIDHSFGEQIANYIMAQIINIERGLYVCHENQKMGKWVKPLFPQFRVLSQLTIGILEGGRLGIEVAKLLGNAGAKVILSDHNKTAHEYSNFKNISIADLSVIFQSSDYLCSVLPSAKTKVLLNAVIFRCCCQKKPVFINIGKGYMAKEETLIRALNEEYISMVVLDSFEKSMLPSSSPLWKMPQVIITPGISAVPRVSDIAKFIAENYRRYTQGQDLPNIVNWNRKVKKIST